MVEWFVGFVRGRVVGGLVVFVGVDTEDGEVACVTGPLPVVGVVTELAYALGWGAHEAYVVEDFIADEEELVVVEEAGHANLDVSIGLTFGFLLGHRLHVGHIVFDLFGAFGWGQSVVYAYHNAVGHINQRLEETNLKPRHWQVLFEGTGPVAIVQIVVLHGRELLYGGVAAVVVGKNETLVGDNLACASSAKDYYGVFDGTMVDAVDLVGCEAAAHLVHCFDVVLLNEREQPHAFIGQRCADHAE